MTWLTSDKYCDVKEKLDPSHTNYFHLTDLELHHVAWICAGFCAVIACALSFYLIYRHCSNYTCPSQQKHIIRILLIVPIYSIDSFFSFRFYWLSIYFDVIRDCYEAFVIYTFYSLLIEYLGGYKAGKDLFASREPFKLPIPLNCITISPKRGLLRQCKRLTLQYVIIRPTMTSLAIILHSLHEYCPGNFAPIHGYLYISFINFISVTVAMYALVLFYSKSSKEIAKYKPIPKFASVKFVIMLSFWQALIVAGIVAIHAIKATAYWTTENIATGVQNALLCLEMLIAAIWHIFAYNYHDFEKTGEKTPVLQSAANCFNPYDIAQDIYYSFYPKASPKLKMSTLSEEEQTKQNKYIDITVRQDPSDPIPEEDGSVQMQVRSSYIEHRRENKNEDKNEDKHGDKWEDSYVEISLTHDTPRVLNKTENLVDISYKSDSDDSSDSSDDSVSIQE